LHDAETEDDEDKHACSILLHHRRRVIEWPSVWSEDTWMRKKVLYKLLECGNGKLVRSSCESIPGLQTFSAPGRSVSDEWAN